MYVCGTVCICELHVRMSYVMYMYSCTCITITIVHVHTVHVKLYYELYCSLEIAKLIMKKLCRKVECRVSSEHHPASSLQMCALLGTFFDVVVGGREACCGANLSLDRLHFLLSAGNAGTQNKHVIKATMVNSRKLIPVLITHNTQQHRHRE